jgi:cardiolipin synthase
MILRNIPNALTLTRLILIAPFLIFLYQKEYVNAFYTFILAGFTDGLDGWLARYFRWQTPFGRFIDPMADKLLIASSFIALAMTQTLPWWLVILVFARDLTISLGVIAWYQVIKQEPDFNPTYLSKINTVLQLALVTLCLYELAYPLFAIHLRLITNILLVLTTLTTAGSYVDYVWTWGKKACATRTAK